MASYADAAKGHRTIPPNDSNRPRSSGKETTDPSQGSSITPKNDPQQSASSSHTPVSSNKKKKIKKRKPTLKQMSLGDKIILPTIKKTKQASLSSPPTKSETVPKEEFPALSSSQPAVVKAPPTKIHKESNSGQIVAQKKSPTVKSATTTAARNHEPTDTVKPSWDAAFQPKPREEQTNAFLVIPPGGKILKGKQRLKPRKKKFSSLKKKVLEERVLQWRKLHPEEHADDKNRSGGSTICVKGYVAPEELEDDDEYVEICDNFHEMSSRVGTVKRIYIPRKDSDYAFVQFEHVKDALAAESCWQDLIVSGQRLECRRLPGTLDAEADLDWQNLCISLQSKAALPDKSLLANVVIDNFLTEDDMEDDDCLQETLADLRVLAERFGSVHAIQREKDNRVAIRYQGGTEVANQAAMELRKLVIGGNSISAHVAGTNQETSLCDVILFNVLQDDDLEDPDCLAESLNDLKELGSQFGDVRDVIVDQANTPNSVIRIRYATPSLAKSGVEGFSKMVIGGVHVHANLNNASETQTLPPNAPAPMYSGDKIIPERFVEMKRVPKIANKGIPRDYAVVSQDESVKPLLSEMLGELMRLQKRAVEEKNTKQKRRLVMGLREVARGLRSHKVKMIVMANNLDEYEALDGKLEEILNLAKAESVPIFFEFSKRALGKSIGKTIKIAVIGVQNVDGAQQQFKKLSTMAPLPS